MKRTSKLIAVLCIILAILMISVNSFATNPDTIRPDQITGSAVDPTTAQKVLDLGNNIVGVVRIAGIIVSVIILLILGIKYMMGSAEEKADYKKAMIPYLVGAVLIFASSTIVGVVYDMINTLNGQG